MVGRILLLQLIKLQGKMLIVFYSNNIPDINKISIVSAAILLAYTLVGLIILPSEALTIQLPGLILGIPLDPIILFAFLISGITATGTHWILKDHPYFSSKYSIKHWVLPALTAWGFGLILFQQPLGTSWWILIAISALALILIMIAEYIMVDPEDARRVPATIGLIALSNTLLLILAITTRSFEGRIFFLIPVIAIAGGLTSLRNIHLQYNRWAFIHSIVIAIIIGEISAALFYLNIHPINFGLVLLGPAYALTSFMGSITQDSKSRYSLIEPLIVLSITWGLALFI